jgi:hypothetical protein
MKPIAVEQLADESITHHIVCHVVSRSTHFHTCQPPQVLHQYHEFLFAWKEIEKNINLCGDSVTFIP